MVTTCDFSQLNQLQATAAALDRLFYKLSVYAIEIILLLC